MSVEIKVFLDKNQAEDSLCFHAVVYSSTDYDVLFDLNETYEDIMVEALNGELKLEYIDNDSYDKKNYSISGSDYEENLKEFTKFLEDFYGLTPITETFELYSHVGVRLVGPGYREGENIPMLEQAQYNARNSLHGLRTALFAPVNNSSYANDDIYINKASGSLVLTLDATKKYTEPIEFMHKIYKDIVTESIDPFQFDDENMRNRYQSVIKHLSDLNNQKRLKELYLIIDGKELEITNRSYLKKESQDIYFEELEIIGTYEGYKKGSNSFELKIPNRGKYYCHLKQLSEDNYDKYQQIYKILSEIDVFGDETNIRVVGNRTKPKTVEVLDISLVK
jgi:hypothetical protein